MKNIKHSKSDIIFLYSRQNIDESLFPQEVLDLKDILFNDKIEFPELCRPIHKKIKLSNSFIIEANAEENRLKPRSASNIKPNSNYNNNYINYNNNNNQQNNKHYNDNHYYNNQRMKNSNEENSKNLVNNNKNNNCNNYINNKKKGFDCTDFFLCKENSISIVNLNLIEYNIKDRIVNLNNDLSYLLNFKNDDKKTNLNDNIIVKGRKISDMSNNSSIFNFVYKKFLK